jgi:hypothetical protein
MNKIKQILYEFRLKNVENNLIKNLGKIELAVKSNDDTNYNQDRLEQLRLMSCRLYLENKLTYVAN